MLIKDPHLKERIETYKKLTGPSLLDALGIEVTELAQDKVVGTMPVNNNTKQPFGVLHGGASVCLAESLSSIGGWLNLKEEDRSIVGLEINANHLKMVTEGTLIGTATPVHLGTKTQVWETKIRNQNDDLVSISRMTLISIKLSPTELSQK